MKVLFLCGFFAKENEQEILSNAKAPIEYSANIFQEKMLEGFQQHAGDLTVLSAPFIPSFPNGYKKMSFKGFREAQSRCEYVTFNNVWGIRNFSRARALRKGIRKFAADPATDKLIVVYSPHTPFLNAAAYAKKKDPRIKICLVVPDLPQYMNLNKKKSILYRVGKKYDIAKFNKLNAAVDSYMLLTDAMREHLPVGDKPRIIVEGIISNADLALKERMAQEASKAEPSALRHVVYTGKLNEKFGVTALVDAFMQLKDADCRLVLCGNGDSVEYIKKCAKEDARILFLGQVTPDVARGWIYRADVLVNPRPNDEEYTKYSFPSKNIEYLLSEKAVVAYMLDGMPPIYKDFLEAVDQTQPPVQALHVALERALQNSQKGAGKFMDYALCNLKAEKIAERIIQM